MTVLSTTYARADLDYKIHIQGTTPSDNAGGCAPSWAYKTCGGVRGVQCAFRHRQCVRVANTNKAEFRYVGQLRNDSSPSLNSQQRPQMRRNFLLQQISLQEATSQSSGPLEPGEWVYFELDTGIHMDL